MRGLSCVHRVTRVQGVFAILAASTLCASLAAGAVQVYVDDDFTSGTPGWGVTHFSDISAAIAAADAGGTVTIFDGTYYQTTQIVVNKALTLQSGTPGVHPTISFSDGAYDGISIQADDVTLQGLHLYREGHSAYVGLVGVPKGGVFPTYAIEFSNTQLLDCTLEGGRYGAYVQSEDLTVQGCTFVNNYRDSLVLAAVSGTTTITENLFTGASGSKKAILVEGGVEYPHVSGTLDISYNFSSGKGNFLVFNHWPYDPGEELALSVVHNTIYGTASSAIAFYAAYTTDPNAFDRFSGIAIRDNIISNAGGLAVKVDYAGGGAAVAEDGQITVTNGLSFANSAGSNVTDPTGNYGYSSTSDGAPSGASMAMFALSGNLVGDPLFSDVSLLDFSLLVGSPALGAASDGTNIGAWQGGQAAVPEPLSLVFFGTGLAGVMGFVARRRAQRSA